MGAMTFYSVPVKGGRYDMGNVLTHTLSDPSLSERVFNQGAVTGAFMGGISTLLMAGVIALVLGGCQHDSHLDGIEYRYSQKITQLSFSAVSDFEAKREELERDKNLAREQASIVTFMHKVLISPWSIAFNLMLFALLSWAFGSGMSLTRLMEKKARADRMSFTGQLKVVPEVEWILFRSQLMKV